MDNALVVEDDPRIAGLCRRLLVGLGLNPVVASTGKEATDLLARTEIAMAFAYVDLGLPDASGLEIADAARRLRPELRIVLATGAVGDIDSHGHRVLRKPFTLDEFKRAVAET